MRNFTKIDLFSWMAFLEELSIDCFGEDPKNYQNLELIKINKILH